MAVHKGVGHYGAPITLDQAKKVMAAAGGSGFALAKVRRAGCEDQLRLEERGNHVQQEGYQRDHSR
jgi:hypothetical protein